MTRTEAEALLSAALDDADEAERHATAAALRLAQLPDDVAAPLASWLADAVVALRKVQDTLLLARIEL